MEKAEKQNEHLALLLTDYKAFPSSMNALDNAKLQDMELLESQQISSIL